MKIKTIPIEIHEKGETMDGRQKYVVLFWLNGKCISGEVEEKKEE